MNSYFSLMRLAGSSVVLEYHPGDVYSVLHGSGVLWPSAQAHSVSMGKASARALWRQQWAESCKGQAPSRAIVSTTQGVRERGSLSLARPLTMREHICPLVP